MAMAPNKMMTIVVLGAILLAGIGAIGLVYFAPSVPVPTPGTDTTSTPQEDQSITSTTTFSTGVLQRSDYSSLDLGLISQGRLPVQAPTGTGKSDPFQ